MSEDTTDVQTDDVATDDASTTDSEATTEVTPDNGDQDTSGQDPVDITDENSQNTPDTYADFVMPEGVEVDNALLAEATPLFKELGLSQEQAQKLVDFQAKQMETSSQGQTDAFNQMMKDWQDQARNDKEYGGDKFEENVKVAQNAINKFGTPELKQLLNEHGVGNHPEMIRFMVKVGKNLGEDVPGTTTSSTSTPQDRVSLLYPNDKNN